MQLIEALLDLCKSSPSVLAIDGPAGAGKTTLANELKRSFGKRVEVIHMDDLYGGWELSEDFSHRLLNLVTDIKVDKREHRLEIYDWRLKRFATQRTVSVPEILILEGVGAGQSAISSMIDALIWIDVDEEVGLTRVLARDGDEIRDEMVIWQKAQKEHFLRDRTRERADFELTT